MVSAREMACQFQNQPSLVHWEPFQQGLSTRWGGKDEPTFAGVAVELAVALVLGACSSPNTARGVGKTGEDGYEMDKVNDGINGRSRADHLLLSISTTVDWIGSRVVARRGNFGQEMVCGGK
jgi:hypothetical protein